jgi:hypothetical protein
MRLSHDPMKISASFDDPNLVSRAGLHALPCRHVRIAARTGVYPEAKVACLVAGMAAGADSIDDMGLLRHGAMPDIFGRVRAPSTLGSFLRSFTWGNVRQLEKVSRELLAELARRAPLLPGADQLAFVDLDAMQRRVYGHQKQGAAFGHTKISGETVLVRGLNTLAATICTPQAAPVIAGTRLRGGSANTARGAASFTAEAIGTARAAGCAGTIVARADSGLYCAAFTGACRRAGAYFSVTARMDPAVKRATTPRPAPEQMITDRPHERRAAGRSRPHPPANTPRAQIGPEMIYPELFGRSRFRALVDAASWGALALKFSRRGAKCATPAPARPG